MAYVVPVVTLALPILHAFSGLSAQQLHPTPLTISGLVCASPHDMKGIYQLNAKAQPKNADELLGLARDAGLSCLVLKDAPVLNGGAVIGPDGRIEVSGGLPLPIFELIERDGSSDTYLYVVAKKY